MPQAYRFDKGTMEPIERYDGFLRAKVTMAKPGVFPYLWPDGKVRLEAKLPDEIFSQMTIESAKGAPVTNEHPPLTDNNGMINSNNYKKYVKGAMGDSISVEDGYLIGSETVFDSALIEALKRGEKREVSIGFTLDIDHSPGELNGERYDAVQRNIRINHLAHTDLGRAGNDVRVHLDSINGLNVAYMQKETRKDSLVTNGNENEREKESKMPEDEIKVDSSFWEGMKNFLNLFKVRKDSDQDLPTQLAQPTPQGTGTPVENTEKTVKMLQDQIDSLKGIVEEKTKQLEQLMNPSAMDALIMKRSALIDVLKTVNPEIKTDGVPDKELKLKVIQKALPFGLDVKIDSLTDGDIDARYDAATAMIRERANLRDDGFVYATGDVRVDEADVEKKRKARMGIKEQLAKK